MKKTILILGMIAATAICLQAKTCTTTCVYTDYKTGVCKQYNTVCY